MLRWFHKNLKPLARGLSIAVASLWLMAALAPCAMAQAQTMDYFERYAMMQSMAQTGMKDCNPITTVSCQLPDINSPIAASLGDFAVTPILLGTLPISFILAPQTVQHPRQDFYKPDIPAPPLHIQHLTLIL